LATNAVHRTLDVVMRTAILMRSIDLTAWRHATFVARCRKILPIDRSHGKFRRLNRMRERFFTPSRFDAVFVNEAPESVTLTWIESEGRSVQMTCQQELVLA
jgi:hypothetical protein